MENKNRLKILTLAIAFNLILSIMSPSMIVFAGNENIKLILTTNKNKVESGEKIEFDLKYEPLNGPGSVKDGEILTFKLPDVFKDIKPTYPPEHFKSVTVDGTTVTAIFSEGANDAIGGYMSIKAIAKDVKNDTPERVEVSLNGTVQYLDIKVVPKEVVQPEIIDREIYKAVDNPDGYEGYENRNLISNINKPVVGKKVKYSIYVNEKYSTLHNTYINDKIPRGMNLVKNSVKVHETKYGQVEKDVTDNFQGKMNLQNNSLYINFGTIDSKYRVSYDVIVNQEVKRYDNTVNLVKDNEILTSLAIVKPKDDKKMIDKYSRTNEMGRDENGNVVGMVNMVDNRVTYTLDINPSNKNIENAVVEDNIPKGMKLVDGSIRIGNYDISGNFEWVTNKIKDKIKFENNKLTVNIGNTNRHYLIYYDLEVTKREKAYNNTAKLSYDNTSKKVNNIVRYEMNAGAINARKKVDKTSIKKGDSQIVNYTIDFDCYGYFNKGYLNLTDKLDPKVKILKVDAPKHFTVNIDKDTNTINITNDIKQIEYGEPLQVNIKTDFSDVDDGQTVKNIAKINSSTTNIVETKKGYKFSTKKIDSMTNLPLSGATFNLMDSNKKVINTLTSNSNGVIESSIDMPGDYYLKEVKAPSGYNLDSKEIKFTIKDSDLGTTLNIDNIKNSQSKHSVIIKKVDATNEKKALLGAKFEVQNLDGSKVATVTTGVDGLANVNLLPGKYQLVEVKAPTGYALNSDNVAFEVKLEDDSDINLVVKNNKINGSIEITKTDLNDSKNMLANAEFTIFDSNKKEIKKALTDKDGKVVFNDLEYGNYYYKETKEPKGYKIDDNMYPFEIKTNKEVLRRVATNEKIYEPIEELVKPNKEEPSEPSKPDEIEKPNKEEPSEPIKPDEVEKSDTDKLEKYKQDNQINSSESGETNKFNNPKTSDSSMLPYIGLFTISTMGLALSFNNRRKK